jgi:hypothetical protein
VLTLLSSSLLTYSGHPTASLTYLKALLDLQQKVAAAIAIREYDLVRSLLPQLLMCAEWRSPLLGSPLSFVTSQGGVDVVRTVLQRIKIHDGHGSTSFFGALDNGYFGNAWQKMSALEYAISGQRPKVLVVVKGFYEQVGLSLSKVTYNGLLSQVISSGEPESVRTILCMNARGSRKVTLNHLREAAKSHNPKIMMPIVASPGMTVNKAYVETSPLIASVRYGDIHMVRAVLQAGAEVNLKVDAEPKTKTALGEAMATGKEAMTQMLLDYGATMPPRATWPHDSKNNDWKHKGVREVLENENRKRRRA